MSRHVTHVPLRWADIDAYGHVNNVVYLRYLQEARVDMLFVHAASHGAEDLAAGVLVVRHDIDYVAPLRFRTRPLTVETWVCKVSNATLTLGYDVLDGDDGPRHVYASASTTLVPYDLAAGRPRRLTADEKAVLARYAEPGWSETAIGGGETPATGDRTPAAPVETTKTHVYECTVRFDDLDSYGHVNNVTFVEYLQEARIDFSRRHLRDRSVSHQGIVVASQSIDYLAPVPYRSEPLLVHVWVTRVGDSSFSLAYDVRDGERSYARATTALVAYDVDARRTRTLNAMERAALEPFVQVAA